MGKPRRTFSEEFKRDAVARIAASGESLSQTARSLGIQPNLLQLWRSKLSVAAQTSASKAESVEEENRRLRREIAGLREDREILKKAAVSSTGQRNSSVNVAAGVRYDKVFLGRVLSFTAMRLRSR